MNPELLEDLPLVCPSCRRQNARSTLHLHPLQTDARDSVREGLLACPNGCRYPILDGVPVVLHDMADWWRQSRAGLSRAAVGTRELAGYFDRLDAVTSEYHDRQALLGTYLDAHYGNPTPPEGLPDAEAYWQQVSALAEGAATGGVALELGCGVGRFSFELARRHERVIGLDLNFDLVATAERIQRSSRIDYARRQRGRRFAPVSLSWPAPDNVLFLVADALDPPFEAEGFDLVAALNLLDNVPVPLTLIGQMDALLRRGGALLLGSPYEWRHDIAEPGQWLEDADRDAPAVLRALFGGQLIPEMPLEYRIGDEIADLPWVLRQHERFWQRFALHLLAARKG
ncbi:MAG: methyltransferase domain-containing protein [Candidatus Competibacterales bacterium]|nr:methyltransferase domain-containing protein [Candidatus Competibacterales bacterium]